MHRESLKRALSVGGVAGVLMVPFLITTPSESAAEDPLLLQRPIPECPGENPRGPVFPVPKDTAAQKAPAQQAASQGYQIFNAVPLSGPIANIPEYHDCQDFILRVPRAGSRTDSTYVYDSLYAILAAYRLDSVTDMSAATDSTSQFGAKAPIRPVATIYSDSPVNYDPLGIKPGFNCLFLSRQPDGSWRAKLVPIPPVPPSADCTATELLLRDGTELEVRPLRDRQFTAADYPPTARWDWDAEHHQQYIGIMCGDAWCEVGKKGFVSSRPLTAGPDFEEMRHGVPAPTDKEKKRVWLIKGWYDRQMLARQDGRRLIPSGIFGVIIPHPSLPHVPEPSAVTGQAVSHVYDGDWLNIGAVIVDGTYKDFKRDTTRMIYYCHQTSNGQCKIDTAEPTPRPWKKADAGCTTQWFGQLRVGKGRHVGEGCAFVTNHKQDLENAMRQRQETTLIALPSTARWRWLRTDESGGWFGCEPYGCCKT